MVMQTTPAAPVVAFSTVDMKSEHEGWAWVEVVSDDDPIGMTNLVYTEDGGGKKQGLKAKQRTGKTPVTRAVYIFVLCWMCYRKEQLSDRFGLLGRRGELIDAAFVIDQIDFADLVLPEGGNDEVGLHP